jgi:CheY-like chemotaxis protein
VKPSLLIADADEELAVLHQQFFTRHGHAVQTARSGLECLSKLREWRPDVLVLDADLPWGSGDAVLSLVRQDRDFACVPVIFQVSSPWPGLIAPPVVAWLLKPVRLRELVEKVNYASLLLREQQPRNGTGSSRQRGGLSAIL